MANFTKKEMIAVVEDALKSNSRAEGLQAVAIYEEWRDKKWCLKGYEKRKACVAKHSVFLSIIDSKKGKGMKLRREFVYFIFIGGRKIFNTEQEQYEYVNKFGRGKWEKHKLKCFDEDEMKIVVELAHDYGAFDY